MIDVRGATIHPVFPWRATAPVTAGCNIAREKCELELPLGSMSPKKTGITPQQKSAETQSPGGFAMTYDDLAEGIEQLNYRDKFRLAQLLIQTARKEEEERNPQQRQRSELKTKPDQELVQYVADRLRKLRPSKKETVFNSIGAMFQFRGGITEGDKEHIFLELQKKRHIIVGENGRVQYSEV